MQNISNFLPKNLHYLRKQNRLLQEDMYKYVGIQRSTWSNYENGVTDPSVNDLILFSRFFGITLDELLLQDIAVKEKSVLSLKKRTVKKKDYAEHESSQELNDTGGEYSQLWWELKKMRNDLDELQGKTANKKKKLTPYKRGRQAGK